MCDFVLLNGSDSHQLLVLSLLFCGDIRPALTQMVRDLELGNTGEEGMDPNSPPPPPPPCCGKGGFSSQGKMAGGNFIHFMGGVHSH